LLDGFLDRAGTPDWVIANGDYSCDSAYLGLSDPAAYESAALCLQRLRDRFAGRLLAIMGDHELGKRSMAGGFGGSGAGAVSCLGGTGSGFSCAGFGGVGFCALGLRAAGFGAAVGPTRLASITCPGKTTTRDSVVHHSPKIMSKTRIPWRSSE